MCKYLGFYRYVSSQKKTIKVFHPLNEEEELVLQIQKLNLMVSLRMRSSEMNIVRSLSRLAPFMDDIVVSKDGVTKILKCFNPSKALGPA